MSPYFVYIIVYMHVCMCIPCDISSQKRMPDLLALELQTIVSLPVCAVSLCLLQMQSVLLRAELPLQLSIDISLSLFPRSSKYLWPMWSLGISLVCDIYVPG